MASLKRHNILLTGGSGFLGRAVLGQADHVFTAPTHQQCDLEDEISTDRFFKTKHFDCVVHCASVGGLNRFETQDIFSRNINMFENILRNEEHYNKLINIGSGAEYGKQLPIVNVKEDFIRIPDDNYGKAKQVMSMAIERIDFAVNLRCFGVWGKGEKDSRFITSLLQNKDLIVHDCTFSYCYIDDLVKIIDWFIRNDSEYNIYNVGGVKIKLSNIVKKTGWQGIIIDDGLDYTCDDSRLRKELNFKFSNFDQCLKKYKSEF